MKQLSALLDQEEFEPQTDYGSDIDYDEKRAWKPLGGWGKRADWGKGFRGELARLIY